MRNSHYCGILPSHGIKDHLWKYVVLCCTMLCLACTNKHKLILYLSWTSKPPLMVNSGIFLWKKIFTLHVMLCYLVTDKQWFIWWRMNEINIWTISSHEMSGMHLFRVVLFNFCLNNFNNVFALQEYKLDIHGPSCK